MIIKTLRLLLGNLIVFINFITLPKPLKRSQDSQEKANKKASELTLYQFHACPFCVKVRRAIHSLNIPIQLKDAKNNPTHRKELENGGGKIKVPCLHINTPGKEKWLYESKAIIRYLNTEFQQI